MQAEQWQAVMRGEWNARARANAMHYVEVSRRRWDTAAWFRSGAHDVARLADGFCAEQGLDPARARMLEIGCGAGRMTRAFAARFARVDALDVSDEMLARARVLLADCPNVTWRHGNGVDLTPYEDDTFDFVFSYIVFQHIPDAKIVLGYVREIARVLRPGGICRFQVRTLTAEPEPLWRLRVAVGVHGRRWLARLLPAVRDAADEGHDPLKSAHYASWAGSAVPLAALRATLDSAGLRYRVAGAGTQYTWVSARKPGPPPAVGQTAR